MLVLSRKPGEWVELYDRASGSTIAKVFVVENRAYASRLGFEADFAIGIRRNEVIAPGAAAAGGNGLSPQAATIGPMCPVESLIESAA